MDTLEILQAKVSDTEAGAVDLLMALEEVEQYIKTYCNITSVPKALRFVHANMAADLVHARFGSSGDAIKPHEIVSIQVDDVSVQSSREARSHHIDLDDLLYNYRSQLNKFRRLVWR